MLASALAALGLGGSSAAGGIGAAGLAALEDHLRLLLAWNRAINLTAIRTAEAAVPGHVLDSLAAVPLLRAAGVSSLLDIGSGGGYPGIPLAIALPARRALLVESVGKKARFLATAVDALGLRGRAAVAATRAETLAADPHHRERWPAVTARAVAPLPELVELAFPLLVPGGILVAWKRSELTSELAAAAIAVEAMGRGTIEVHRALPGPSAALLAPDGTAADGHVAALETLRDHVLVLVRKAGPTPRTYPRGVPERRRNPW